MSLAFSILPDKAAQWTDSNCVSYCVLLMWYLYYDTHKTTPPSVSKRKKNTGKTSSMSNTAYKRHNQISLPFKNVHTVAKTELHEP